MFLSVAAVPVKASEDNITQEQLYELFRKVIMNAEAQYGEPQKYDVDDWASMLDGVCFARLVDFNHDGLEELILVYETNEEGYHLGNFRFEIWCYNGDNLTIADSGGLYGTDGGTKTLCITEYNGNTYIISGMGDDFDYQYYHGYGENGFGIVREATYEWCPDTDNIVYTINGYDVSEGQWTAEQDAWRADASFYMMNQRASADAIKEYKETKCQLGFNNSVAEPNILNSDYILPNSSTEYITVEQLVTMNLSEKQLMLARNEIFARRGRTFNTSEIQQYFDSKAWYTPQYTPEEFDSLMYDIFNDIELVNIDVIKMVEEGSYVLEKDASLAENEKRDNVSQLYPDGYDILGYEEAVYSNYMFLMEGIWPAFIKDNTYIDYCMAIDSSTGQKALVEGASIILKENLTTDRYVEILSGLIVTMSSSIQNSLNRQKEIDTLKTAADYAIDVSGIIAGSVGIDTELKDAYSADALDKIKDIKSLIGLTSDTMAFTLSSIEDMQACERLIINYDMYAEFLDAIEENAEDRNLVEATRLMKKNIGSLFQYQLDKALNATGGFAEIIGNDIIFEPVISMMLNDVNLSKYSKAEISQYKTLEKIVKGMENIQVFDTTFNLGVFAGDMLFGTSNTFNRYNEMLALSKIRTALNVALEKHNANIDNGISLLGMEKGCNLLRNVIYVDLRGYYCLYNMLENDSQLLSLISFDNYNTYEKWFESAKNVCESYIDNINHVFPDLENFRIDGVDFLSCEFDRLLGNTYEYDDGSKLYQLYFSGTEGNVTAKMGTYSSTGTGTGGVGFEVDLFNGISSYERVSTYVTGFGVVENNNSVIISSGNGVVHVNWKDDSHDIVVDADFVYVYSNS